MSKPQLTVRVLTVVQLKVAKNKKKPAFVATVGVTIKLSIKTTWKVDFMGKSTMP